jgi:hypothetical protein
MQHWIHKIMFFNVPESVFTIVYLVFFSLVAISLWFVRPRLPHFKSAGKAA